MESQITAAQGSLASVGQSLAGVGAAGKAFALAHPMGMAVAGGALLGAGAYYAVGRMFKKKNSAPEQEAVAAAA